MRSSLASGKSATPPARCIHRPQRDTSSAEYRLLVSLASCGASRELSSRRSPAHPSSDRLRGSLRSGDTAPYTCAVSPTFRYGAFSFVASALADLSSARLTTCDRSLSVNAVGAFRVAHAPDRFLGIANRSVIHPRIDDQTNQREAKSQKEYKNVATPDSCAPSWQNARPRNPRPFVQYTARRIACRSPCMSLNATLRHA